MEAHDLETRNILRDFKRIVVVGLSRDETKYSRIVARFMQDAGYKIIPVNPVADEPLLGEKVFGDLDQVDVPFDIVDVFRPSDEALGITMKAVAKGAKVVWLQEGIVSAQAQSFAESRGVGFVQDKCIMKEYLRIFGDE